MKKVTLFALLLVAALLAACAAPAAPADSSAEQEPTAESATTEESAEESANAASAEEVVAADGSISCGDEEVTITYIGDPAGSHPAAEAATIERFKEVCPNITVERIEGDANVQNLLAVYLTAFEAQSSDFDVIRVDVIWPGLLAEHLLDLSGYVSQAQIDSYIPSLVQNDTVDGQLVAVPLRIGFGMLYYRTDLLEKYGFDAPPATWEDLASMAQTIQDGERAEGNEEFWGYVWQGSAYEGLTTNALEWQVSNGGGSIVSPEGEIEVNNAETLAAFERAAGWVGTISPPGVVSYQEEDARGIWHAGNAAFMRNWPYAYSSSTESEAVNGNFNVAPVPAGDSGQGAATLGGWHIGVSRYSAHPAAAAAFAAYMTSAENEKHYSIDTTSPPGILDLYSDPDIQASMPFADPAIVEVTTPRPSTATAAKYNEVSTLYFTAVHSILTGEEDAQTALELLELDLMTLLDQ
ncbi:MAG: ABC transporter substrate-binding protein [Caldilineaceae bacterium]|nr:ABC transporter substrate-binding protein [Caldilineaceae bacterium]